LGEVGAACGKYRIDALHASVFSHQRRRLMPRLAKKKYLREESPIAPIEMPGLDSHLCFALYAASNHMTRLFAPFLEKLGVTYPQYLALVVLWERGGPLGVGEFATLLRMDLGTLSPMLKRLEAKGLVTRRRPAADERRVLVDLTPKGISLRKKTEQMLGEFYCFLNVPVADLFDLKDRLRRFVDTAGPAAG
jgi:DNA-binding MarR family transcriptional regulator